MNRNFIEHETNSNLYTTLTPNNHEPVPLPVALPNENRTATSSIYEPGLYRPPKYFQTETVLPPEAFPNQDRTNAPTE